MSLVTAFPLISVLALMLASFAMPLLPNRAVKALSLAVNLFTLILSIVCLFYTAQNGTFSYSVGHYPVPFGIEFLVGIVESVLAVTFCFVAVSVLLYAGKSIEHDVAAEKIPLYYLLINLLMASLLGIVFTNDLFNAYVFIEVGNLASCGIVVLKDERAVMKAGMKYLLMSSLGSGLILLGTAFLYTMTGHLNMTWVHTVLTATHQNFPRAALLTVGLFSVGLMVKAAVFPLHTWLPDAHSGAPTPSSALLSSVVLKAYLFLLIKILFRVFGPAVTSQTPIFAILFGAGAVGMIAGSLLALRQKNLKRIIAYSSVAQVGYIVLAIGLQTPAAVAVALYHMITHALTKAALFLGAGLFIEQMNETELDRLGGFGKYLPVTTSLFGLGALSLIGIPPLPGFVSKWQLSILGMQAELPFLAALLVFSGLLNAAYLLPIICRGFFGVEVADHRFLPHRKLPTFQVLPIFLLIFAAAAAGVFSAPLIGLLLAGLT
jgi:multicomponent Na+:H+ antiporter subunit D